MGLPAPGLDAVIIGGGPAGAAAARLLAGWGHAVVLLTRSPPRHTLAESIPPSCRKLFAELGVLDVVEAAGFYPTRGNTVWWGKSGMRSETFPDGVTGFQVERRALDRVLLDSAEAAGAAVHRDATVREVTSREVCYERQGKRGRMSAPWVLDCSGRAGVIARRGLRVDEPGHVTLAVYGVWERAGWNVPDETHTLVESYQSGWAWAIPVSPSVRYVAVMFDPGLTSTPRGSRLSAIYQREISRAARFHELLDGAKRIGAPRALGASPYTARRFAGPGFLLVGDAGSFIDPLSSFGVKKALASAWLAAVVVHTCVRKPEMGQAATDLFEARERQAYASYAGLAARFFGEAARDHDHPFWRERSAVSDREGAGDEPSVEELRTDPAVLAAFERLKELPAIHFQPSGGVRTESRPVVRDREIVLEPHLVCPWVPAGIRFLRGVDLVRLVELAPRYDQVPDLYEAYNRGAAGPAGLPDFLGALSVLVAKDVLI